MAGGTVIDSGGGGSKWSPMGVVQTAGTGAVIDSIADLNSHGGKIRFVIDESSKLTNLRYNANTWGQFIPITWGIARVQGYIVWAGGFKEKLQVERWKRTGTEGKNKFETTLGYYYTTDIAYSFGFSGQSARPRHVNRIILNNAIVYDRATGYRYPGLTWTWQPGNNDQLKDPSYVADKGEFAVAFRNQMTLFIRNLPIDDFGQAIPACIVEAYEDPNLPVVEEVYTATLTAANDFQPRMWLDWKRRKLHNLAGNRGGIHTFDIDTRVHLTAYPTPVPNLNWVPGFTYVPWKDWIITQEFISNSVPTHILDATTGALISTIGGFGVGLGFGLPGQFPACVSLAVCPARDHACYLLAEAFVARDVAVVALDDNGGVVAPYSARSLGGQFLFASVGHPHDSMLYYAHNDKVGRVDIRTGDPIWNDAFVTNPSGRQAYLLFVFDDILVVASWTTNSNDGTYWEGYDAYTGTLLWSSHTGFMNVPDAQKDQSNLEGGNFAWPTAAGLAIMDLRTGSVEIVPVSIPGGAWDSTAYAMYIPGNGFEPRRYFVRQPGTNLRLDTWMEEVMVFGGYDPADLVFEGIEDEILGAFINKSWNLNQLLVDVCALYRINKVERDGKVYFSKNFDVDGNTIVDIVIPYADLVVLGDGEDNKAAIEYTRANEVTMPASIGVTFINPEVDYQEDTYTWSRPAMATKSTAGTNIAVPIVATKSNIATLVQNMLYDVWHGKQVARFRLPQRYSHVDPGTVVQIERGEYVDVLRITETTENGDWSKDCIAETIRLANKAVVTVDEYIPRPIPRPGLPDSQLFVFDTPTLTLDDASTENNVDLYYSAGGIGQANWPGAYLARATAGQGYTVLAIATASAVSGRTTNVMAVGPDIHDSLYVFFNGENPLEDVSAPYADVIADENLNLAFYGANGRWEIIQFASATLETSNKRVRLDGVIRGRRGTDYLMGTHLIGDWFVLVGDQVFHDRQATAVIGTEPTLAAVGIGQAVEAADKLAVPVVGRSLYPWAPVIREPELDTGSGDITFRWFRRDRLGFQTLGGAEVLPMSEATEAYEVDIMDGSTVLRTLEATTTEVVYTAADQVTDDTVGLSELTIRVYQMSATVGRGFKAERVVHVF